MWGGAGAEKQSPLRCKYTRESQAKELNGQEHRIIIRRQLENAKEE